MYIYVLFAIIPEYFFVVTYENNYLLYVVLLIVVVLQKINKYNNDLHNIHVKTLEL